MSSAPSTTSSVLPASRLQQIAALAAELPATSGLPALCVLLAQGLAKLMNFDQLALVMQAPDGKRWALIRPRLSTGPEPGWAELEPEPQLEEAMSKGQPSSRNGSNSHTLPPGFEATTPIRELSLFPAAICLPLKGDSGIIGAVGVFSTGGTYSASDLYTLSVLVPIIEAVARELLLREENARLKIATEEGERLRGEMISLFQSDLRNPLVVIDNGLDFLQSAMLPATAEEARDHVEELRLVAATLVEMVDTQSDLMGLEAGWIALAPQPLRLDPWMKERVSRKAAAARMAEVQLLSRSDPGDVVASFDSGLMGRVADNLLMNAIRHTPRKGQVAFVARQSNGTVTLAVGDTGTPVPADQREMLFERTFYSAPDAVKPPSRAYGLPFCKAVVEAHGGRISIEAPPGGGNLFRLVLPV